MKSLPLLAFSALLAVPQLASATLLVDLEFGGYGQHPWEYPGFELLGGNVSDWDNHMSTAGGYLVETMSTKSLGKVGYQSTGISFQEDLDLTIETAFQMVYPLLDNFTRGSTFLEVFDGANRFALIFTSSGVVMPTASGYVTIGLDLSPWRTFRLTSPANSNAMSLFVDDALIFSGLAPPSTLHGFQSGASGADWDPDGAGADANWDYVRVSQAAPNSSAPEPATLALFAIGLAGIGYQRFKREA